MSKFKLVNPMIAGTFTGEYDTTNANDAACMFWKDFTGHLVGHMDNFKFSLQKNDRDKTLHHFSASEDKSKNKFKIEPISVVDDKKKLAFAMKQLYDKAGLSIGGSHKKRRRRLRDDSSSSSSSSSSEPIRIKYTRPITNFRYISNMYAMNPYNDSNIYNAFPYYETSLPMFAYPLSPVMSIAHIPFPIY